MSLDFLPPPPGTPSGPQKGAVFFDRGEFNRLLRLYGSMVAQGEWRDYGIDADGEACSFSVFRRTAEAPLYRIEKRPALARKQGAWAVMGQGGVVMRRGHELEHVLKLFDSRKFRVVE